MPGCVYCKLQFNHKKTHEDGHLVTFHTFPKETGEKWAEELRKQGLTGPDNSPWTPKKNSKLCSIHFDPNDIERNKDGSKPCVFIKKGAKPIFGKRQRSVTIVSDANAVGHSKTATTQHGAKVFFGNAQPGYMAPSTAEDNHCTSLDKEIQRNPQLYSTAEIGIEEPLDNKDFETASSDYAGGTQEKTLDYIQNALLRFAEPLDNEYD